MVLAGLYYHLTKIKNLIMAKEKVQDVDVLSEKIQLQNEYDILKDSFEKQNLLIEDLREENSLLKGQLIEMRDSFEDKEKFEQTVLQSTIKENSTVTPLESFEHLEKGFNCVVHKVGKDHLIVSNKDNPDTHKERIKAPIKIFKLISILILVLFSSVLFGQNDTTNLDSGVTTIVNGIFEVLDILGISVSPFRTIILAIVLFIIRRIEKKSTKEKIAKEIENTVIDTPSISNSEIHEGGAFKNLINKLRGKKEN